MHSTMHAVVDPWIFVIIKHVNDDRQISINSAYMQENNAYMRANNAYMLSKMCMVGKRTHILVVLTAEMIFDSLSLELMSSLSWRLGITSRMPS